MDTDYSVGYNELPHDLSGDTFTSKQSRHTFVMKVYNILCLQLLYTFGMTAIFTLNESTRNWVQARPGLLWLGFIITLAILIALACCDGVARTPPGNYICLTIFTLIMGYTVAVAASFYTAESVVYASAITVVITIALTLFACQTKYDFTGMGPYLFVILLSLFGFGIVLAIICRPSECEIANAIYSAGGALLFSCYIVYDTQLILGKDHHKYKFNEDEYVFAALNLYLDIINLFLKILSLLGKKRDN